MLERLHWPSCPFISCGKFNCSSVRVYFEFCSVALIIKGPGENFGKEVSVGRSLFVLRT